MTLFEDKHVVVLNKAVRTSGAGRLGHEAPYRRNAGRSPGRKGNRPVLVHRLDRDTSGVLLIAKSRKMVADSAKSSARWRAENHWALVEGVPKPAQGRISLYLASWRGHGRRARRRGRRGRCISASQPDARWIWKMRVAKHGEDDAQHSLTYYAIVDKIAEMRLAVDEAADRPHAPVARPCGGDRPSRSSAIRKYGP